MKAQDYAVDIRPLSDEDGGGFVAIIPELPGCMADGDTAAEALTRAQDAIASWIEEALRLGRAVPAPKAYA
jgi:predicted RNase H-like HicB family nuclease